MTTRDNDAPPPVPALLASSWQAAMLLGALTLILGFILRHAVRRQLSQV
jgi:hypothetical protein